MAANQRGFNQGDSFLLPLSHACHDNSSFRGSSWEANITLHQKEKNQPFNWIFVLRAFLLGILAKGFQPRIIKSAQPVLSYTYTNTYIVLYVQYFKDHVPPLCAIYYPALANRS